VYLDYLRISVDGQLVMGLGLEYNMAREYHDKTRDYVIGSAVTFPPIHIQAGMLVLAKAHYAECVVAKSMLTVPLQ